MSIKPKGFDVSGLMVKTATIPNQNVKNFNTSVVNTNYYTLPKTLFNNAVKNVSTTAITNQGTSYSYPPALMRPSYTNTFSGLAYGNGTYITSVSNNTSNTYNERNGAGTVSFAFCNNPTNLILRSTINTIAGNGTTTTTNNVLATGSGVYTPVGINVDALGNMYIAESGSKTLRMIPAISGTYFGQNMTAGYIYTIAGNGTTTTINNVLATSTGLNNPNRITVDISGNVYATDDTNNIVVMIPLISGTYFGQTMTAGYLYKIAGGNGTTPTDNVAATSSGFNACIGIAVDTSRNLYIGDYNNTRLRMVPAVSGTYYGISMTANYIYTLAGGGSNSANNILATSSAAMQITGVSIDASRNIYFGDAGNNRVRMIPASTGTYFGQSMTANYIYTVAGGNGTTPTDNVLATSSGMNWVQDVQVDTLGNLYMIDFTNLRIRMVPKTTGTYFGQSMTANYIYTIIGNGTTTITDGVAGTSTGIGSSTSGISIDTAGNVYVTDYTNKKVRMLSTNYNFWQLTYTTNGSTYTANPQNISTVASGTTYYGEYAQIQLPSPIIVTSYSFVSYLNTGNLNTINEWAIVGSTNGSTWYLLDYQNYKGTLISGTMYNSTIPIGLNTFYISNTSSYNYYRFIYINSNGLYPITGNLRFYTNTVAPTLSAPTGLTFISATTSSVTFSFTASSGSISGYTPYVNGYVATGSGTASSYTITGLPSGTSYSVTLSAYNSGGNSGQSSSVTMSTVSAPNAPTGIVFISSTTTSVTFSFTAPSGTVTGYTPYVNGVAGTGSGTASSYTITGLSTNTTYSVTISAQNSYISGLAAKLFNTYSSFIADFNANNNVTASSGSVSSWVDRYNSITATGGTSKPVLTSNFINSYPALDFSTVSNCIIGNTTTISPSTTNNMTLFFVLKTTSTKSGYATLFNTPGSWVSNNVAVLTYNGALQLSLANVGDYITSFTPTNNTPFILVVTFTYVSGTGTVSSYRVNGTAGNSVTSSTNAVNMPTAFQLGNWDGALARNFAGGIGEFIYYTTSLSTSDIQQIEGNLSASWGIPLVNTHPYYNALTTVNSPQSSAVNMTTISTYSPTSATGCQLWFDANDISGNGTTIANNTSITTWYDKSGYGRNATANTGITYNTTGLNSKPALNFNSGQYLTGSVSITTNTLTIFTVLNMNGNTSSNARLISLAAPNIGDYSSNSYTMFMCNGGNGFILYRNGSFYAANDPPSNSLPYLFAAWYDGTNYNNTVYYGDSTKIISGASSGNFGISSYCIGNDTQLTDSSKFYGYISEIIVYNTSLSTTDRQKVEGYLSWKWGLQSNLASSHPYYSAAPSGTPSAPSAPTGLTFISATYNSVTFSFTAPSGTVTGYTPYVNGVAGTGSGTATSYTISGLSQTTTYSITLAAYNAGGSSSQSSAVNMTTTSRLPSAPTGLTFISATSSSLTFSFTASTGTVTGYTPYVNGYSATGSGTASSYTITGLSSSTTFSVTMSAYNSNGNSGQSTAVNMTTTAPAPAAPTGLTFIRATSSSVTFSFTAPSGTVTGYTPYVNGVAGTGSGTATSYTITGLSSTTTYSITMVAYNANGSSSQSSAVNMTTGTIAILYYTFETTDVSGSTLLNRANNLYDLTLSSSAAIKTTNAAVGTSSLQILTNGTQYSNYINNIVLPTAASGNGYSFSMWVYMSSLGGTLNNFMGWSALGEAGYGSDFQINITSSGGGVYFAYGGTYANTGANNYMPGWTDAVNPADSTWHHFCFVFQYTGSSTGTATLYRDNVAISTQAISGAKQFTIQKIGIGHRTDGSDSWIGGYIDQFFFYTIPLTKSQVTQLYNKNIV